MAEWLYQIEGQSKHGGMLSTDRNQRLITDIKLLVLSSAFGSRSAAWAYDHTWYNLCPCRISKILMYFVLQLIFYSGVCWVVCLASTYVVLNNGQFFPLHVSATTSELIGPTSDQSRTCVVLNRPVNRSERSCLSLAFLPLSLHAVSLEFVRRGKNGLQMQTPAWKNQRSERNSTEGQVTRRQAGRRLRRGAACSQTVALFGPVALGTVAKFDY